VRCCRVGYDMDLDFSTCNNDSDSDKKGYISVGEKKIEESNSDNRSVMRKIRINQLVHREQRTLAQVEKVVLIFFFSLMWVSGLDCAYLD